MKRSGFSGRRKRLKPVSDKRQAETDEGQRPARKRLPARSAKRVEADRAKPEIRRAVFDRDGWTCRLKGVEGAGACFGELTPHHVRKASQGGGYTLDNLVTACRSHNDRIESDADLAALARSLGLVLRAGDQPSSPS